jgi:hypothetical protein
MYKFNQNSIVAKFYNWIWSTNVTKFKTICPYVWKYIATIIFLPIILVCKFLYYLMPGKEKVINAIVYVGESKVGIATGKMLQPSTFWDRAYNILKWLFIGFVSLIVLALLIFFGITFYKHPMEGFAFIGVVTVLVGVIFLIAYLFTEYPLLENICKPFKFIGVIVSSTYHKYCPRLDWKK